MSLNEDLKDQYFLIRRPGALAYSFLSLSLSRISPLCCSLREAAGLIFVFSPQLSLVDFDRFSRSPSPPSLSPLSVKVMIFNCYLLWADPIFKGITLTVRTVETRVLVVSIPGLEINSLSLSLGLFTLVFWFACSIQLEKHAMRACQHIYLLQCALSLSLHIYRVFKNLVNPSSKETIFIQFIIHIKEFVVNFFFFKFTFYLCPDLRYDKRYFLIW